MKRKVQDSHVRHPVGKHGVGGQNHVLRSEHAAFHSFQLFSKLVCRVDLDFHVAVGFFGDLVGKHGADLLVVVGWSARMSELQNIIVIRLRCWADSKRQYGHRQKNE